MKDFIKKLNFILGKKDKLFLFYLFLFSIVISIIEALGISAIMPFLTLVMNPENINTNFYFNKISIWFNFESHFEFIFSFGLLLIFFYFFRSLLNILYINLLAKFSQTRNYNIATSLFKKYLQIEYKTFVTKNTSELNKTVLFEANNLTTLISSFLFMISEIFIIILIYAILMYVNFEITLILTFLLVLSSLLIFLTISKEIKKEGSNRAELQRIYFEIVNKSFGNFKLIKLQSKDDTSVNEFSKACYNYAKANIKAQTLIQMPRFILEALAFSIIIVIVLYLLYSNKNDISSILTTLTIFVLSLYRLMPSINRIINSYNTIMFSYKSLELVHADLYQDSEKLGDAQIKFFEKISLTNLFFSYSKDKSILENINLDIKKGEKIAFVGESGSGKSTLVNIIIGLHSVSSSQLKIDDKQLTLENVKSWRKKIGYIPQDVYLFDGTVADNVVFNNKYDEKRIISCLKKAKIFDFLNSKEGLNTKVGEGGVMLSGGQKQRIAIARALYTNPELLVLDEATSALDKDTETQIMNEIYEISSDKTLIIIAHRLSTIQRCNKVYKLVKGRLIQ